VNPPSKLTHRATSPCAPAPFSAINTKPRAVVWLAGRIILQLSSLSGIYIFRKAMRPSKSVPATGLRFGNKTLPKGSFKKDLQT
jgi:hypothetical protein